MKMTKNNRGGGCLNHGLSADFPKTAQRGGAAYEMQHDAGDRASGFANTILQNSDRGNSELQYFLYNKHGVHTKSCASDNRQTCSLWMRADRVFCYSTRSKSLGRYAGNRIEWDPVERQPLSKLKSLLCRLWIAGRRKAVAV